MNRILVIDDESWLREMIRLALEQHGFEVIEAESGADGVAKGRKHLPDLILCDVNMDRAGAGYQTLSKLREDPTTAAIPFILMTGMADAAGMRHGMELGADDYLPKPFKVDELYATVDARLRKVQTVRAEAEKKLSQLRNQITLMLPHEMRTPLNGIVSNAELLATAADTLAPKEIAEMGREISESGSRLERLIENFLVYAQIQIVAADPQNIASLRAALTSQPAKIVRDTAAELAERCGRSTELSVDATDAPIAITEDYFKKILAELVQNAFKYSSPGSMVFVQLAPIGKEVELIVSDSGRGFSYEQIQRIDAYMQFDRKMQDVEGLGLGLAIAKKLTELHGGTLSIESIQGHGSTITVRLPKSS
jgi:signal transduction histidine kinase